MKSRRQREGRKTSSVVDSIRKQILDGELRPGDALPTRTELLKIHGVSNETLQRAANILLSDGYLTASRGVGTRVANNPPHLSVCAVVIPARSLGFESRLWKATRTVAEKLDVVAGQRLKLYYGGLRDRNAQDNLLIDDVLQHRVGAVIMTTNHARFQNSPVVSQMSLPRVAWSDQPDLDPDRIPVRFGFSYESFIDLAVASFARRGCRRIAAIGAGAGMPTTYETYLMDRLMDIGAVCPARWRISVHAPKSASARNIVQLLVHGRPEERPDGLLILDDNLELDVCEGLRAAGILPPNDIHVISHANFPLSSSGPQQLAVEHIGFDIESMLRESVTQVVRIRQGLPVQPFVRMDAAVRGSASGEAQRETESLEAFIA